MYVSKILIEVKVFLSSLFKDFKVHCRWISLYDIPIEKSVDF